MVKILFLIDCKIARWKNGDIAVPYYQGVAPIHLAAQDNKEEVVRYLVTTAGCPVDIVSIYILT